MRWKKFLCGTLVALMIFSASAMCSAEEESANEKLARIEIDTYGTEQSGALLDRISRLEKDYSGQNMAGNMNARIEAIYNTLYDNAAAPGILAKLNALEWNINHEVAGGGVGNRLTLLENQILGTTSQGTFNDRIRALAKNSYGNEILPIAQVQIPANTLIKVETTAPAGSKFLQEGDVLPVRVIEDVFIDGNLVFARGLPGEGTVTRVVRAKNIFSNGKIETDFNKLKTIDGQTAATYTGIEAIEEMTAKNMAHGLSLIGQTFSGKNKGVEEVFVRGKNIDLPAGVEMYVQIREPIVVYGVKTSDNGLYLDDTKPATQQPVPIQPNEQPQPIQPTEPPAPATDQKFGNGGLSDDEMTAKPPAELPPPVNAQPPAPAPEPKPEPAPAQPAPPPAENKPVDDGEIIEIIDEE